MPEVGERVNKGMMEIDRQAGVAVWHQIEQQLAGEIAAGRPAPGAQLPNELEIARRFGVHRHTARRAVAALVGRGLVRIARGQGTFVEDGVIDYVIGKRTRFSANLLAQSREPGHRLLAASEIKCPPEVAKALKLTTGTRVVLLETVGEADGQPISVSSNYFPAKRFPDLATIYQAEWSVTKTLKRFGIDDYTRQVTRVTARMPSPSDADHLRQPRTRPILVTESVDVDGRGVPIAYHEARFSGERVQLVIEP